MCATAWADQSDPRLSGGVRELNNTPIERGWVYSQLRERGVNNRVNNDIDNDFCSHVYSHHAHGAVNTPNHAQ